MLWSHNAPVATFPAPADLLLIDEPVNEDVRPHRNQHPYSRTREAEPKLADGKPINSLEDDGERCEEDVQDTEYERRVNTQACHDRFEEDHVQGSDQDDG